MAKNAKPARESLGSPLVLAGLVVLLFALGSLASIGWIHAQAIPTLENDTDWLVSYFEQRAPSLSEKQKRIVHESASITSAVAEDAGVTVTLQAVCGNGYNTIYKLDVQLPEPLSSGQTFSFERQSLLLNDNDVGLSSSGSGSSSLEDENPMDAHYPFLLRTMLSYSPLFRSYAFNNGVVRTLRLENLQISGETPETSQLIEGTWEFGILFQDEGKVIELVQEPVLVQGFDFWTQRFYEAEITSFSLTEFSMHCQYRMTPRSEGQIIGVNPVIILKDGRTVNAPSAGGGGQEYSWNFWMPISLSEVAFVKLTDGVVLPMP